MNTTKLIEEWTMSGADRDGDGRFRSVDETRGVLSRSRGSEQPAQTHSLLVKHPDEDEWLPLGIGRRVAADAA